MFDFHEITKKLIDEQNVAIDGAFITFIRENGLSNSTNVNQIKDDIRSKGFEIITEMKRDSDQSYVYVFKVIKVVAKQTLIIKPPVITFPS